MNPAKICAIMDWPKPTNIKHFYSISGWLIIITVLYSNLQRLLHPYLPCCNKRYLGILEIVNEKPSLL